MATAVSEFVARLEKWREAFGLSHGAFAREVLGVDDSTWSQVRRSGQLNAKFVGRVVLRYPWLARFLNSKGSSNGASDVDVS